jgi:hypothetical protein
MAASDHVSGRSANRLIAPAASIPAQTLADAVSGYSSFPELWAFARMCLMAGPESKGSITSSKYHLARLIYLLLGWILDKTFIAIFIYTTSRLSFFTLSVCASSLTVIMANAVPGKPGVVSKGGALRNG